MIIGLSTYNPNRDFLNSLARAGIDCVELSLPGREYAGFDYAAFATRARDAGLDIRSFHLPFYLSPEDGPVDHSSHLRTWRNPWASRFASKTSRARASATRRRSSPT